MLSGEPAGEGGEGSGDVGTTAEGSTAALSDQRIVGEWAGDFLYQSGVLELSLSGDAAIAISGDDESEWLADSTRLQISGPVAGSGVRWHFDRLSQATALDALASTDLGDRVQQSSNALRLSVPVRGVAGGNLDAGFVVASLDRDIARERVQGASGSWFRKASGALRWGLDAAHQRITASDNTRERDLSQFSLRIERQLNVSAWGLHAGSEQVRALNTVERLATGFWIWRDFASFRASAAISQGLVDGASLLMAPADATEDFSSQLKREFVQTDTTTLGVKLVGVGLNWRPSPHSELSMRISQGDLQVLDAVESPDIREDAQRASSFRRSLASLSLRVLGRGGVQTLLAWTRGDDEAGHSPEFDRSRELYSLQLQAPLSRHFAWGIQADQEITESTFNRTERTLVSAFLRAAL